MLAERAGLEPAAFRVTGGRYNQLNYHPAVVLRVQIYIDFGTPKSTSICGQFAIGSVLRKKKAESRQKTSRFQAYPRALPQC